MNPIADKSHRTALLPQPRRAIGQDHDLPVLAVEEDPRVKIDWELLLPAGVQPAHALGAERRWHGRR